MRAFLGRLGVLVVAAAIVPACGGGGGGGGGALGGLVAVSGLKMLLSGGTGTTGNGGNGGDVYFENYTRGDSGVFRAGAIDSVRTVPVAPPSLGSNPKTITGTVNFTVDTTGPVGVNQVLVASTGILGDDGSTTATGLWVKPGATLVLPPHVDTNSTPTTYERVALYFSDGVFVEGTIQIGFRDGSTLDRAEFFLGTESLVVAPSGRINVRGADNASGPGGNGGSFDTSNIGVDPLWNAGVIDTSGGNGTTSGGAAGLINLRSDDHSSYNSGTLLANGGSATNGPGGDGGEGYILGSGIGGGFNRGTIQARGGNGTTAGGNGGTWYILGGGSHSGCANSGNLDLSGGNATNNGDGGNGGNLQLEAVGAAVRATGSLVSRGGDGAGAGSGGQGGEVSLYTFEGSGSVYGYLDVTYGIFFGMSLDLRGGNGVSGGNGGFVEAYADFNQNQTESSALASGVQFIGYASLDLSGGKGAGGGTAGYLWGFSSGGYTGAEDSNGDLNDFAVGSVTNEADVVARGGQGTNGNGGIGGSLNLSIDPYDPATGYAYGAPGYARSASNHGELDFRGGDGTAAGGKGGSFSLHDVVSVINTGSINTSGGNGGTGPGGDGDYIEMFTDGLARNTGTWTANGGNSASSAGGDGGDYHYIWGGRVESLGSIFANGGNGATGGDGGYIEILSAEGVTLRGTYSVKAGAGGTPAPGEIWIEGMLLGVDSITF